MSIIVHNGIYEVSETNNILSIYEHTLSSEFLVIKIDKNLQQRYYISCRSKNGYPSSTLSRVEKWLVDQWLNDGKWSPIEYSPKLEGIIEKYSEKYPEYFI